MHTNEMLTVNNLRRANHCQRNTTVAFAKLIDTTLNAVFASRLLRIKRVQLGKSGALSIGLVVLTLSTLFVSLVDSSSDDSRTHYIVQYTYTYIKMLMYNVRAQRLREIQANVDIRIPTRICVHVAGIAPKIIGEKRN